MNNIYSNGVYHSNSVFNIGLLACIVSTIGFYPVQTPGISVLDYKNSPTMYMPETNLTKISTYEVVRHDFNFDLLKMRSMLDCDFVAIPHEIKKAADIKAWILSQKV